MKLNDVRTMQGSGAKNTKCNFVAFLLVRSLAALPVWHCTKF